MAAKTKRKQTVKTIDFLYFTLPHPTTRLYKKNNILVNKGYCEKSKNNTHRDFVAKPIL